MIQSISIFQKLRLRWFLLLSLSAFVIVSCKNNESELINFTKVNTQNFNTILSNIIEQQCNLIEDKAVDYAFIRKDTDSIIQKNKQIDKLITSIKVKNIDSIKNQNLIIIIKNLNLKTNNTSLPKTKDSILISELVKNNLLRTKYEINENFIKKRLNFQY